MGVLAGGVALGEPAEGGVVVAGAEFVQPGGGVEETAGVAEGVVRGGGPGDGAGDAVRVVGVGGGLGAGGVDEADDRAEVVGEVVRAGY